MDNREISSKIKLIAKGDNNALVCVYEAMKTQVYGLALGILKDRELAEDVMQTTFLKLKTNAEQFQKATSGKAWLLKIAQNSAYDCLRKRREVLCDDLSVLEYENNPDNDMDRVTDSIVIQEALKVLDPEENQIVFLHLYCDLKHREVGRILGIPTGTAGRKYSQAISKLKSSITLESFNKSEEAYV